LIFLPYLRFFAYVGASFVVAATAAAEAADDDKISLKYRSMYDGGREIATSKLKILKKAVIRSDALSPRGRRKIAQKYILPL